MYPLFRFSLSFLNCSYYQSPYYGGSNPPSARASLSRDSTPATGSSSSYYSRSSARKYSEEPTASILGDTSATATPANSYYGSSAYGRRTSLSRTSTLDDDDATDTNNDNDNGVRSYYNSARKQFQQQQAAIAALNAQTPSDRFSSARSTGGSSYFRNKLAKSRSSHAIGKPPSHHLRN